VGNALVEPTLQCVPRYTATRLGIFRFSLFLVFDAYTSPSAIICHFTGSRRRILLFEAPVPNDLYLGAVYKFAYLFTYISYRIVYVPVLHYITLH